MTLDATTQASDRKEDERGREATGETSHRQAQHGSPQDDRAEVDRP